MRNRTNGSVPGLFVQDVQGGIILECPSCEGTHVDTTDWGIPSNCPYCKKELHYPEGASW